MRKKCILKSEFNTGAQVFFYDQPITEDHDFNYEHVRVYFKENDEKPFLRCHISQIIDVPNNILLEKVGERYYPSNQWFFEVSDVWRN